MHPRLRTSRWAVWAFVAALLLKAATPLLASVAAGAQGRALVEVCTVYGVATAEVETSVPGHDASPATRDPHCALSLLLAVATPPADAAAGRAEPVALDASATARRSAPADAAARWAARLQHGPPRTA